MKKILVVGSGLSGVVSAMILIKNKLLSFGEFSKFILSYLKKCSCLKSPESTKYTLAFFFISYSFFKKVRKQDLLMFIV